MKNEESLPLPDDLPVSGEVAVNIVENAMKSFAARQQMIIHRSFAEPTSAYVEYRTNCAFVIFSWDPRDHLEARVGRLDLDGIPIREHPRMDIGISIRWVAAEQGQRLSLPSDITHAGMSERAAQLVRAIDHYAKWIFAGTGDRMSTVIELILANYNATKLVWGAEKGGADKGSGVDMTENGNDPGPVNPNK